MNKVKLLSSIASAVLLASSATWAAAPTGYNAAGSGAGAFDAWSVSSGTVTINLGSGQTCPTGWTCGAETTGNGFYQRQVTDGSNNRYFQTIITDTNATGAPTALTFGDESFVKIGVNGLAGQQRLSEVTTTGTTPNQERTTFSASSVLGTGWAGTAGKDTLTLSQAVVIDREITNPAPGWVSSFDNSFGMSQETTTGTTTVVGKSITMAQLIETGIGGTTDQTVRTDDDLQKFVLREYSGTLQTTAHPLTDPDLLPAGAKNIFTGAALTDIAWVSGDNIKVSWVGQQSVSTGTQFSFQSYENLTAGTGISYFSTASQAPFGWVNPPFGAQPTLP